MEKLFFDCLKIKIIKKQIKNLYIRILPPDGDIIVSAPDNLSDEKIYEFIRSKKNWILKHVEKFKAAGHLYDQKNEYYLWGNKYNFALNKDTESNINLDLNKWYKNKLKTAIIDIAAKCENIVGVKANEIKIRDMSTRWGSCNITKKRIWINLNLVKLKPKYLEYVMIHELVHLLEKNHNTKFYNYMDKFYPGWKTVRKELNAEGQKFLNKQNGRYV